MRQGLAVSEMKRVVVLFLVLSLAASGSVAFAQMSGTPESLLDQKKEELKELQQQIEEQEKLLQQKRKERQTLANQVAILDQQIQQTELELKRLTARGEALNLEHSLTNKKMVDAEEEILQRKLVLREILQVSYEQRRLGTLEILLTATTFSDFMTRLEYIRAVEEKMTTLIGKLGSLLGTLKEQKATIERIQAELKALQLEKELEQNSLAVQISAKNNLLTITKGQETEYAARLEESRREYLAVSAEISRLMQGLRRAPTGPKTLVWPISSRRLTAGFYDREYEATFGLPHTGIDIATPQGTPIRAPADGVVTKIRDGGARGLSYMVITHANGLATAYLHLSGFAASTGAYVVQGQVIAYSGGTPGTPGAGYLTTGPHLHFEVWDGGVARNPLEYLS